MTIMNKERPIKIIYSPRNNENQLSVLRTKSALSEREIKASLEDENYMVQAIVELEVEHKTATLYFMDESVHDDWCLDSKWPIVGEQVNIGLVNRILSITSDGYEVKVDIS